jgi:hypothetical protein
MEKNSFSTPQKQPQQETKPTCLSVHQHLFSPPTKTSAIHLHAFLLLTASSNGTDCLLPPVPSLSHVQLTFSWNDQSHHHHGENWLEVYETGP